MSEDRKLLYPELVPYYSGGQVLGVRASLHSSLVLHLRRLIQAGQASFLPTAQGSLTCDVTLGVDGRGDEKADIGNNEQHDTWTNPQIYVFIHRECLICVLFYIWDLLTRFQYS